LASTKLLLAGQGSRLKNLYRWGHARSAVCKFGQQKTTNHTVNFCPLTTFDYLLVWIMQI